MSETTMALGVWLPAGTILPFLVSRLTGADRYAAIIEATMFAFLGLLIYPTLLALLSVRFVSSPSVDILFGLGFVLASLTVVGYRRRSTPSGRR